MIQIMDNRSLLYRFQARFRYHSLTFKQFGNSFKLHAQGKNKRGVLELAKLGQVKMVMLRPLKGTPKTAIVKRTPTGKRRRRS